MSQVIGFGICWCIGLSIGYAIGYAIIYAVDCCISYAIGIANWLDHELRHKMVICPPVLNSKVKFVKDCVKVSFVQGGENAKGIDALLSHTVMFQTPPYKFWHIFFKSLIFQCFNALKWPLLKHKLRFQ